MAKAILSGKRTHDQHCCMHGFDRVVQWAYVVVSGSPPHIASGNQLTTNEWALQSLPNGKIC